MSKPKIPFKTDAFWKVLASYSFRQWSEKGVGCVLFVEPEEGKDIDWTKHLSYVPYDPDEEQSVDLPDDVAGLLDTYNPSKQVVLVERLLNGTTQCHLLDSSTLRITPVEALREVQIATGGGCFITGEILTLQHPIEGVAPGTYVFLEREGVQMVLCEARYNDSEPDILLTGEFVRCHSDFESCFESGIGILNAKFGNE